MQQTASYKFKWQIVSSFQNTKIATVVIIVYNEISYNSQYIDNILLRIRDVIQTTVNLRRGETIFMIEDSSSNASKVPLVVHFKM